MSYETPKIYVACLAAYNNGKLHGTWIDATDDPDDIRDQIQDMLKNSPEPCSEEYAIHDYSDFENYRISEWEDIDILHEVASFIEEHGKLGAALLDYYDIEEAKSAMSDQYAGEYTSAADFIQELTEDTTDIPEHLAFYIDYDAMARDAELSGDFFTIETGFEAVHIFWH